MEIKGIEKVSQEVYKLYFNAEPSFFVRTVYLNEVDLSRLVEGAVLSEQEALDLTQAGLCFAAERKALDYLERCEHSRFGLSGKLINKGFEKQSVDKALDYLEKKDFLSDSRFARSFLNMRKINHCEGRIRLEQELAVRGISREVSKAALDEFFSENNEEDFCRRAVQKCIKIRKNGDKMDAYLQRCGFSYKIIRTVRASLNGKEN